MSNFGRKLNAYSGSCLRIILQRQGRKNEFIWNYHPLTSDVHSQFRVVMGTDWTVTQRRLKSESNQKIRWYFGGFFSWKTTQTEAGGLERYLETSMNTDALTSVNKRSHLVLQAMSCHSSPTLHIQQIPAAFIHYSLQTNTQKDSKVLVQHK